MDLYTKIIAESQIMRVSCKICCKQRFCKCYLVFTVADLLQQIFCMQTNCTEHKSYCETIWQITDFFYVLHEW